MVLSAAVSICGLSGSQRDSLTTNYTAIHSYTTTNRINTCIRDVNMKECYCYENYYLIQTMINITNLISYMFTCCYPRLIRCCTAGFYLLGCLWRIQASYQQQAAMLCHASARRLSIGVLPCTRLVLAFSTVGGVCSNAAVASSILSMMVALTSSHGTSF